MSYIKHSKPRRKLQHQPTDIDELSKILHDPSSGSLNRNRKSKTPNDGVAVNNSKGRSKSAAKSKSKPSKSVSKIKSKSVPALPSELARTSSEKQTVQQQRNLTLNVNSLEPITFKIGNVSYEMDDSGEWSTSMKNTTVKAAVAELRTSNRKIAEENNLMRVKNELLLDMITTKNLRIKKMEQDLLRLRKVLSSSSLRFSYTAAKDNNK